MDLIQGEYGDMSVVFRHQIRGRSRRIRLTRPKRLANFMGFTFMDDISENALLVRAGRQGK